MISRISFTCRSLVCRQKRFVGSESRLRLPVRFLSSSSGDGGGGGGGGGGDSKDPFLGDLGDEVATTSTDDDIFGVNYEDGEDRMGPITAYPPQYKRDSTTGRFTGEVEHAISEDERKILTASTEEKEAMLAERIDKHWQKKGDNWASELGRRVREAQMGLNVLGRSPKAQATRSEPDEEDTAQQQKEKQPPKEPPRGFSQRLTREEFLSFRDYMKQQHNQDISTDDFPVMENEKTPAIWSRKTETATSPDNRKLALKWSSNYSRHQVDDANDPYSDIMPADLNVHRLVGRREAKLIPRSLLHHNNLALLKSFLTPTSQIKHRIHTRLGAKDQRKIAKLIRRARVMGLLPFTGQCTVEQQGWIHSPDIHEEREWEAELKRRGLIVQEPEKKVFDQEFEDMLSKK